MAAAEEVVGLPRREQSLDAGDEVLLGFARDLRRLREAAGGPTYRELSARAHYSVAALSEAANGRKLPSLAVTLAYVAGCNGDLTDWETRWRETAARIATPARVEENEADDPPYRGLKAFQVGDAEWFYGRDKLIDDLLKRMAEHRFVGVFGASGSGKSSVLRAGLVAQLAARGCPTVVLTPGSHPVEECAIALAAVVGRSPVALRAEFAADPRAVHVHVRQAMSGKPADVDLILVVDQFEEIFTLCRDDAQRGWLITALVNAASAPTSRTRVVLGVRADFYAHCGHHAQLAGALSDAQVLIGPMTPDELRVAISEPAARAGLRVETALMSELIAVSANQPGMLPLISHALLETWRRRRGTMLSLAAYEATGGVMHALARTAEAVYAALNRAQQAVVKQIFLRLTALGDGTEDTKRRIQRGELDNDDPNVALVLARLAQARLITLDRDTVEPAHERIIQHWPRLRDWLSSDRDGLRIHRELTEATVIWDAHDRDPGALYRGSRLAIAEHWASSGQDGLTPREREFLDASRSERDHEQATARRRTRRLRRLVALLSVLLILSAAATVYAIRSQRTATQQRNVAVAQQAARQAMELRSSNPALAVQLALTAYQLAPAVDTRSVLSSMMATPYATRLTGHTGSVYDATISHDGRLLATAASQGPTRMWDVTDPHRPHELPTIPSVGYWAQFSPNGQVLATSTSDGDVGLWDITDPHQPQVLATITDVDSPNTERSSTETHVAFSPDGRMLATASLNRPTRIWDITDPRRPTTLSTLPRDTTNPRIPDRTSWTAFSPHGHTLATAGIDHPTRLWDITDARHPILLATLDRRTVEPTAVFMDESLTYSPDGHTLAAIGADSKIRLWDVHDPRQPRLHNTLPQAIEVSGPVAFSPDGRTLAINSAAGAVTQLWAVTGPSGLKPPPVMLAGHTASVYNVTFSPDGRTVITVSGDLTVRLWDISMIAWTSPWDTVRGVAFSANANIMAATTESRVQLWDVTNLHHPKQIDTQGVPNALSVAVSEDGRVLATAHSGQSVRLWSIDSRRAREAATLPTSAMVVATSSHRTILATLQRDRYPKLWDITDPHHPKLITTVPAEADRIAFGADASILATTTESGKTQLWSIQVPQHPAMLATLTDGMPQSVSVAFSPNAPFVAQTAADGNTRIWDITNPQHPTEVANLPGGPNTGTTFASTDAYPFLTFSADGRTLATFGGGRTVRLWDTTNLRLPLEIATLTDHDGPLDHDPPKAVLFGSGGMLITTDHNVVKVWETDPERLADYICQSVYPGITPAEWAKYLPNVDFQPPCS